MESQRCIQIPTITPIDDFYAPTDVAALKAAFKTPGDESTSTIINILTQRSYSQRQEIIDVYKKGLGKELEQDISSVFSSKGLKVMLALLQPVSALLVRDLEKALSGLTTDDEIISEILCTRSNSNIAEIQLAFQNLYGKTILSTIRSDHNLSSNYKDLMTMVLGISTRNENKETNLEKASKRAGSVHNAVQEGWSTATKIFTRLLTHESFDQLCLIFDEYRLISGLSAEEAIKSTFSGDLGYAYLAIVKSAINKSQYYAETLEVALKKLRRDDGTLIRIFIGRCEIDLESIKREYLRIYHKTLYNAIRTETNGTYREIMLSILGAP